jgi:hypothetical protein
MSQQPYKLSYIFTIISYLKKKERVIFGGAWAPLVAAVVAVAVVAAVVAAVAAGGGQRRAPI